MKYWPASAMLKSPLLKHEQKLELVNFHVTGISASTFTACQKVASRTKGANIAMIRTENAAPHRVYLERPTDEDWNMLERCIFIDTGNSFWFNADVLQ